jgi:hypothetical protein
MRKAPIQFELLRRLVRLSGLALSLSAVSGCRGDLEPCAGVEIGANIEIEILSPSDAAFRCHEDWALSEGRFVLGTIAELSGEDDCKSGVPEVKGVEEWSWTRMPKARIFGGYTLQGRYMVTKGACAANLDLRLSSDPPLACDASLGDRCNLELRINPSPGSESSCPEACFGNPDVRVRRL